MTAHFVCGGFDDVASMGLLETWIDEAERLLFLNDRLGHKRKLGPFLAKSALPLKADIGSDMAHVSFVPIHGGDLFNDLIGHRENLCR